jgi:hypothetical protein
MSADMSDSVFLENTFPLPSVLFRGFSFNMEEKHEFIVVVVATNLYFRLFLKLSKCPMEMCSY